MENARFRIAFNDVEIEFEGTDDFVEKRINTLNDLIQIIQSHQKNAEEPKEKEKQQSAKKNDIIDEGQSRGTDISLAVPKVFGEWLNMFRTDIMDIDKSLITAYYIQKQSDTNDFKTSDITEALIDHGIKLSNPSWNMKALADRKYMFQTRKEGKLSFKRVSKTGEDYLKSLLVKE